jgi:hypothetical protein
MDFKAVLSLIIKRFSKEQVRYALMGGFALGALGVPRATDEARTAKEYLDIEALMEYYGSNLDWVSIKEYFGIFDKVGKFNELKKRFCDVKR